MSRNNEYLKRLRKSTIKQVVDDLLTEKISGVGGALERDSYEEKITTLAFMGVTITRGALYKRVSREYINLKHPLEVVNATTLPGSEVSSLTSPSSATQEEVDDDNEAPPEMGSRGGGDSDDKSDDEEVPSHHGQR